MNSRSVPTVVGPYVSPPGSFTIQSISRKSISGAGRQLSSLSSIMSSGAICAELAHSFSISASTGP